MCSEVFETVNFIYMYIVCISNTFKPINHVSLFSCTPLSTCI